MSIRELAERIRRIDNRPWRCARELARRWQSGVHVHVSWEDQHPGMCAAVKKLRMDRGLVGGRAT
jgi:hypothetical protein